MHMAEGEAHNKWAFRLRYAGVPLRVRMTGRYEERVGGGGGGGGVAEEWM